MQEHQKRSAEHVRRAEERMSADALAAVVKAFLDSGTTGNRERMQFAVDAYTDTRCA